MNTIRMVGVTMLLGTASGCVHVFDSRPAPTTEYHIKCDGACLELKKDGVLSREAFLARFEEHWNAGRKGSAIALAHRFPDVAIPILRMRGAHGPASEAQQALAECLGKMLADDEAVRAALAQSEAERRQGKTVAAVAAWQQGARLAARWGVAWKEPNLWEALIAQRPLQAAWPLEIVDSMLPLVPASLHGVMRQADLAEFLAWHTIGAWRLERGEPQAALAAFGNANSYGRAPGWDEYLQLQQARAWLAL